MSLQKTIEKYNRPAPRYTSYPTANHFHAGITQGLYQQWLSDLLESEEVSLYFHIPFCRKLCWYCGCNMRVVNDNSPLEAYKDILLQEISMVAKAIGRKQKVSHIHWGGGTPTILEPSQFREIITHVQNSFDLLPNAEHAIEIDPRVLSKEKIDTLKEIGVNRASLGVQDFDPDVQEAINRVQSFEQTEQAVTWLRSVGINEVNFDLIYGLPLQTEATIRKTVELTKQLGANRVALFGYAHVPWVKSHQKLLEKHHLPTAEERNTMFDIATEELTKQGYNTIGIDHFALPEDTLSIALNNGTLHRNFQGYTVDTSNSLIGMGVSSISCLPQGYAQNDTSTKAYTDCIENAGFATVKGMSTDTTDHMNRKIIEEIMCYFAVDIAKVCTEFENIPTWQEVLEQAMPQLQELIDDGFVTVNGSVLTINEEGKMLTRIVCACFDTYLVATKGEQHAKAI